MQTPEDLKPKFESEAIQVHVPSQLTAPTTAENAKSAGKELGLYEIDDTHMRAIRSLGVKVEEMGVTTMCNGHIFMGIQALSALIGKLSELSNAKSRTMEEMQKLTYTMGYAVDKFQKAINTASNINEIKGMAVTPESGKGNPTRQSFQPGAIIHAAPGSNIQIGMLQQKENGSG